MLKYELLAQEVQYMYRRCEDHMGEIARHGRSVVGRRSSLGHIPGFSPFDGTKDGLGDRWKEVVCRSEKWVIVD